MKILRYELHRVIAEGIQEIQVPYFSQPLDCIWESNEDGTSSAPVLYYGNEGGGSLRAVTIKAISERDSELSVPHHPRATPEDGNEGTYLGIVKSQEGELFFLFSSLKHTAIKTELS